MTLAPEIDCDIIIVDDTIFYIRYVIRVVEKSVLVVIIIANPSLEVFNKTETELLIT